MAGFDPARTNIGYLDVPSLLQAVPMRVYIPPHDYLFFRPDVN
jgi:hypothetical protein